MPTVRKRILISGRVQGVGFRWCAVEEGERLGLRGWVRNRRDGQVEALAEGPPGTVEEFLAWCRRGPPSARVERLEVQDDPGADSLGPFAQIGTV